MPRRAAAKDVYQVLAKKFAGTAYVVLPQVPNATGFAVDGWCDAVVASLWPSRGLWLHGYEIKVDRQDWLRELRKGEKAEAHYRHLDYFSVLIDREEIVQTGELPETWGLAVADVAKGRIRVLKEAPRRSLPNAPIDRAFILGLLRAFDKECVAREAEQQQRAEFERGKEIGLRQAERRRDEQATELGANAAFYAAFMDAHGLGTWSTSVEAGARLGRLVKALVLADHYGAGFEDVITRLQAAGQVLTELNQLLPPREQKRRAARA